MHPLRNGAARPDHRRRWRIEVDRELDIPVIDITGHIVLTVWMGWRRQRD